jgi:hypothetical protein
MYLVPSSFGALEVGLGLGIVGSSMQTVVGLMRVQRGVSSSDQSMIKLGLLDVGGGLLWLTWDLLGARQPLFIGSYILVKAGREAYANRREFSAFLASIQQKALGTYRKASTALETAWNDFEVGYQAGFNPA